MSAVSKTISLQDTTGSDDDPGYSASFFRLANIALIFAAACVSLPGAARAGAAPVVINEVVLDPQQDWNDSAGGDGIPFSPTPGAGSITGSDEWIELYNASGTALNLTGWSLEMNDVSPATIAIGAGMEVLVFSSGGSFTSFNANEYLVIGNPVGDMANVIHLILRNAQGEVVDEVQIGGAGQPSADATTVENEALARFPGSTDTGQDLSDFRQQAATPGASNGLNPPSFKEVNLSGNSLQLGIVDLAPGTSYVLRQSSSVTAAASFWTPIATFTAESNTTNLTLSVLPGDNYFYRLQKQ